MPRKLTLLLLSCAMLAACGGGGGGDDTPAPVFSIDRQSVSFSVAAGSSAPAPQTVTGTVSNATGSIYIVVSYTKPELIDDISVSISGNRGTMVIYPASPGGMPEGDYQDEITVSVCNDPNCQSQVAGSPKRVTVAYRVEAPPDSDGDGVPDSIDAFPADPNESVDTDGDGIGNNADPDDDNDGVDDASDEFPLDGSISFASTAVTITQSGDGLIMWDGAMVDCKDPCTFTIDNTATTATEFQVAAAQNFQFTGWGAAGLCDDAETVCEIATGQLATVDLDLLFTEDPHMSVVIDPDANGVVIERFGQLQCDGFCEFKLYGPENQAIELIGLPKPGFDFDGWSESECGTGANCEFSIVFGTTLSVSPTFTPNPGAFDLCPGDPAAAFTGSGQDNLAATVDLLPLCNGYLMLADPMANEVLLRDVVNAVTTQVFALSASPRDMVLVEEHKLLYVTHGATTRISRIDLRTGLVSDIFVPSGAQSVAASDDGTLFVKANDGQLHLRDSETSLLSATQFLPEININYNDATARLIGSSSNYFWDGVSGQLVLQGPSQGGGSGSDCNSVVVSPDGEHAAFPCGGGNGSGYSVFDFYSHDPSVVLGEWVTGPYPSGAAFAPSSLYVLLTNRFDLQLFDVASHQLVLSTPAPNCSYSDTRKLAVSSDGKLLFGITQCGFDNDSAIATWYAYDTNAAP